MLTKNLTDTLFVPASIQRWNDHIRPGCGGLSELDKQAHKAFFSYVLAFGLDRPTHRLVEATIFEFLHRTVLTDLKPEVYYRLMGAHGQKINEWVIKQIRPCFGVEDNSSPYHLSWAKSFLYRMEQYLAVPSFLAEEKAILKIANCLASQWEFNIIAPMNEQIHDIDNTREKMRNIYSASRDSFGYFDAWRDNPHKENLKSFFNLVGQLRFQKRWTQSERTPTTSVLGHSFQVAVLGYLYSMYLEFDGDRARNNFYAGLFHDVAEALTRDVVSPVKRAVPGIEELLADIEWELITEQLIPLLPENIFKDMTVPLKTPFENVSYKPGMAVCSPPDGIDPRFITAEFANQDGALVKICDNLAAYLEASVSIEQGIKTPILLAAQEQIGAGLEKSTYYGLDFGQEAREGAK